jgi:hypothetical protein
MGVAIASGATHKAWRFDADTLAWSAGSRIATVTDLAEALPFAMADRRLHAAVGDSLEPDAVMPDIADAVWLCIGRIDFDDGLATASHCYVLYAAPSASAGHDSTGAHGHLVLLPRGGGMRSSAERSTIVETLLPGVLPQRGPKAPAVSTLREARPRVVRALGHLATD